MTEPHNHSQSTYASHGARNYFEEIGAWPRSHSMLRAYAIGFILSLLLTVGAYELVAQHSLPYEVIVAGIVVAALLQFAVQVYCFLHIGGIQASRDRLFALCVAVAIVGILISGSLWIMFSLNSRMMPDQAQMIQYMNDQGGF